MNSSVEEEIYKIQLTDEQLQTIVNAINSNKTVSINENQMKVISSLTSGNELDFDFDSRFTNLENGLMFVVLGVGILIGILVIFFFRKK